MHVLVSVERCVPLIDDNDDVTPLEGDEDVSKRATRTSVRKERRIYGKRRRTTTEANQIYLNEEEEEEHAKSSDTDKRQTLSYSIFK